METFPFLYCLTVWAVGAIAGGARCVRNGDWQGWPNFVSVFIVSGCLGFGIVAVSTNPSGPHFNPIRGLGIATIIGLAGKETDQIISMAWQQFLGKLKG